MALNFKLASAATRSDNPQHTLLVVDDDQAILFTLRNFFKRHGWHILEADSISAAMKLFDANRDYIDAMVVDYQFDGKIDNFEESHLRLRSSHGRSHAGLLFRFRRCHDC